MPVAVPTVRGAPPRADQQSLDRIDREVRAGDGLGSGGRRGRSEFLTRLVGL
jgi:hypothetical protein